MTTPHAPRPRAETEENPDARLRRHARDHNWPVYDFRAGRRAATFGLKAATAGGAVYGLWKGFARIRGPRI